MKIRTAKEIKSRITISEYQETDREQIIKLMIEFGNYLNKVDDMKRTNYREKGASYFMDKMIKEVNENNGKVYIAKEGNEIIGFIAGFPTQQTEEELMETIPAKPAKVSEFFITRDYRNRGVGKQLISKLERYLVSLDCNILRIGVFAPNKLARSFYDQQGYIERSVYVAKLLK